MAMKMDPFGRSIDGQWDQMEGDPGPGSPQITQISENAFIAKNADNDYALCSVESRSVAVGGKLSFISGQLLCHATKWHNQWTWGYTIQMRPDNTLEFMIRGNDGIGNIVVKEKWRLPQ